MLFAILEIGERLQSVLIVTIAGIPGWLAYMKGRQTATDIKGMHTAINSTAEKLAAVARDKDADLESKNETILRLGQELAELRAKGVQH